LSYLATSDAAEGLNLPLKNWRHRRTDLEDSSIAGDVGGNETARAINPIERVVSSNVAQ